MEHPILFLDLLAGALNINIPPHILYTWFIMLLLVGLGLLASRSISLVPAGAQNVFEWIIGGLEDFMVEITGDEGRAFFPFIATLFLFIWVCNLIGLIPGYPPLPISTHRCPWHCAPLSSPTIWESSITAPSISSISWDPYPGWRRYSSSLRSSATSPGSSP